MSPCRIITDGVIVCGQPSGVYRRIDFACPVCQQERRGIERWDGAWYGVTFFCECGDSWQDGWRRPRPFARYWRRDAQRRFERMWDFAAPTDLYEAYTKADVDMAVRDEWEPSAARRAAAHQKILAHPRKRAPLMCRLQPREE